MNENNKQGKLFVVSGPSGVGKTTLIKEVVSRMKSKLERVITYTLRLPRPGEIDGKDYYFISQEEFQKKMEHDFFLETTDYIEKQYASPASLLDDLALGKSRVIVTDLPGAKEIAHLVPEAIIIWVTPTDLETLKCRLEKRKESHAQMEKRLEKAKEEMKEAKSMHRFFKYHVVNEEFERSVSDLILILEDELK